MPKGKGFTQNVQITFAGFIPLLNWTMAVDGVGDGTLIVGNGDCR